VPEKIRTYPKNNGFVRLWGLEPPPQLPASYAYDYMENNLITISALIYVVLHDNHFAFIYIHYTTWTVESIVGSIDFLASLCTYLRHYHLCTQYDRPF